MSQSEGNTSISIDITDLENNTVETLKEQIEKHIPKNGMFSVYLTYDGKEVGDLQLIHNGVFSELANNTDAVIFNKLTMDPIIKNKLGVLYDFITSKQSGGRKRVNKSRRHKKRTQKKRTRRRY